jgi:hypothetical protein
MFAISSVTLLLVALAGHFLPAQTTRSHDTSNFQSRSLASPDIMKTPKHDCEEAKDWSTVEKLIATGNDTLSKSLRSTDLGPGCVRAVYCIHQGWKPDYVKGEYRGYLEPSVTRPEAEMLFDSPELEGTAYHEWEDMMYNTKSDRWYWGTWNYSQLCYLTNRPEVSRSVIFCICANHYLDIFRYATASKQSAITRMRRFRTGSLKIGGKKSAKRSDC